MSTLGTNLQEIGADPVVFQVALTKWVAMPNVIAGTLLPLLGLMIMTRVFGEEKSIKPALQAAPFALFCRIIIYGSLWINCLLFWP